MKGENLEGRNVARIRKEKGLTQEELAEMTGIDKGYISQIENGRRGLTTEKRAAFAEALGVDIQEFYVEGAKEKPREEISPLGFLFTEIEKAFEHKKTLSERHDFMASILKTLADEEKE